MTLAWQHPPIIRAGSSLLTNQSSVRVKVASTSLLSSNVDVPVRLLDYTVVRQSRPALLLPLTL